MKEQTINKYAHLEYRVIHELEISINEYWYLDMVYQLSDHGKSWCYKSLENIAQDMRLTKNGVIKMRDRLIHRHLIEKGLNGRVRSSVTYNSVYRLDNETYQSVKKRTTEYTDRTTEYTENVQLSGTKINIENNIKNIKELVVDNFGGRGEYSPAKEKLRAALKGKAPHGL